jgi:hypothetical protein
VRRSSFLTLAFVVGSAVTAHATDSMSCNNASYDLPTTHDYVAGNGDVLKNRHIELTRPFTANGKLEVRICNADLRIVTTPDAQQIRLTADISGRDGGHTMADYIETLRVQPDNGVIHLKFPKDSHTTVTLTLPMGPGSSNEIDLGQGDLDFNAKGSAGSRQVNVGMGHMQLTVDHDKNYSKMQVNVGMGSLHDHRPGGQDGHFVVSKDYQGSGSGSLEINVGMGSLDIRNE